jgi:hypothetical protein
MKFALLSLAALVACVSADRAPAPYRPAPAPYRAAPAPYRPAPYHPAPAYKPAPAPYHVPAPAYKPAPAPYHAPAPSYKPAPAPYHAPAYKPAPAPYHASPAHYESYEDEPVYRCPNYPYCDEAPYALSHLQYEIEALRQRAALVEAHGAALARQEPNRPFVGHVY